MFGRGGKRRGERIEPRFDDGPRSRKDEDDLRADPEDHPLPRKKAAKSTKKKVSGPSRRESQSAGSADALRGGGDEGGFAGEGGHGGRSVGVRGVWWGLGVWSRGWGRMRSNG